MTATDTSTLQIPGYTAGTWKIDDLHSEAAFTVRHLMVTKVRGGFTGLDGVSVTGAARQTPAYTPGTWKIDDLPSEAAFPVRHLMVTKVRGGFTGLDGVIVTGDDP